MKSKRDYHLSYGADVGELIKEHTGFDSPKHQPEDYAVYVLRCEGYDSNAYGTEEKFLEDWRFWASSEEFDKDYDPHDPPSWA